MCLKGYVGIRGACKTAKMYIDDLPGINVENAADIADPFQTPSALIEQAFQLAVDQVYHDWINHIKEHFDYKEMFGRFQVINAGNTTFYTGSAGEVLTITLTRSFSEMTLTKVIRLSLYSQTEATVTISILDRFGDNLQDIAVDLVEGYNQVSIDYESDQDVLYIKIPLTGLILGSADSQVYHGPCNPCNTCMSSNDCLTVESDMPVGFDLHGHCIIDRCALMETFWSLLKVPLLYKTGINFFLAVKGTTRINAYTRNSREQIDYFLNLWLGGVDTVTGIKTSSAYWQALKTAADSTVASLRTMYLKPFTYNANQICNHLP